MVAHRRRQLWKTGSCMNCGGNNHIAKDCFQRPRKIGEHYSREKFEQVGLIQREDIIINNTKLKFKESRKKKETGGGRIRKDTKKNVLKFDDVCPVYYSRKTRSRLEFKEPNYNFELGDQLSINSWAGLEKGQGVTNPVAPTKLPRIFTESHEAEIPRSNYDEDGYVNNHTAVWGSWWKDHKWGYKCCKQTLRYSFCTAGFVEAAEAATDNMRPSDDLQMA